ncbi:adenylate kinase-domain-containing protein [Umbelopsis sp. AD052]|nr:adenylate kinase-domain-containing protein [Umbelopsis sp. AD052]
MPTVLCTPYLRRFNGLLKFSRQLHTQKHAVHVAECPRNAVQPLRLLLIGSPGSGKGTQSERIQKNFSVSHISSGDSLRKNIAQKSDIGLRAATAMAKGNLVSDDLMTLLIKSELDQVNNANWLLDGFPRTIEQARILDSMLLKNMQPLNLVINLVVPEEVILGRIIDRWVHIPSGRVYNLSYNPPKVAGHDDVTGEPLSKRPDDNADTFKVRIQNHHTLTAPLLKHYENVMITLKGNTSDEIYPQIERELVNRFGMMPRRLESSSSPSTKPKPARRFRQTRPEVDNEQHCVAAEASL